MTYDNCLMFYMRGEVLKAVEARDRLFFRHPGVMGNGHPERDDPEYGTFHNLRFSTLEPVTVGDFSGNEKYKRLTFIGLIETSPDESTKEAINRYFREETRPEEETRVIQLVDLEDRLDYITF